MLVLLPKENRRKVRQSEPYAAPRIAKKMLRFSLRKGDFVGPVERDDASWAKTRKSPKNRRNRLSLGRGAEKKQQDCLHGGARR